MKKAALILLVLLTHAASYAFDAYLHFDEKNKTMECLIDDARLMLQDYAITTELNDGSRETFCKNGYAEGPSKIYYENGGRFEISYKSGKAEGMSKSYSATGGLEGEIPFKNGEIEGLAKSYYASGKLKETTSYRHGNREGVSKFYYESGKLEREVTYKNDKRNGASKIYRENGKLYMTLTYQNGTTVKGVCHSLYGGNISFTSAEISNWNNGLTVRCY